ncbi:MAG: gamma carbonic anhydrase family protein [Hyphomicrobiaceae bacterium]
MALYSLDDISVRTPGRGQFWVAPGAIVIGNVEIEEDASIWFGSVVRGDLDVIRIGRGSNIQDCCVLHTDPGIPLTVGPECAVGHKAMLHGCTIGRGSLVGIGAIVLNHADIGEESLVGAGTLIPEGKTFPPRSLILGTPGRVARQLTDDDVARIKRTVEGYRARWKRYVAGLRPRED